MKIILFIIELTLVTLIGFGAYQMLTGNQLKPVAAIESRIADIFEKKSVKENNAPEIQMPQESDEKDPIPESSGSASLPETVKETTAEAKESSPAVEIDESSESAS